jgi:hypothetical protein
MVLDCLSDNAFCSYVFPESIVMKSEVNAMVEVVLVGIPNSRIPCRC